MTVKEEEEEEVEVEEEIVGILLCVALQYTIIYIWMRNNHLF